MDRSGDSQMPPLCLCGFPGGGMIVFVWVPQRPRDDGGTLRQT